MRRTWSAVLLALAACQTEGLEGATAGTTTGVDPLAALPWGIPGVVLGVIAGFYARPEGRTPGRQQTTGILTILALIAAGICARAMLGPRWQLGYGLLFGTYAVAGLAFGRLWTPRERPLALAGGAGVLLGPVPVVIAVPAWSGATPYLALACALGAGALGVVIARRATRAG
jgi:hypothetical protein